MVSNETSDFPMNGKFQFFFLAGTTKNPHASSKTYNIVKRMRISQKCTFESVHPFDGLWMYWFSNQATNKIIFANFSSIFIPTLTQLHVSRLPLGTNLLPQSSREWVSLRTNVVWKGQRKFYLSQLSWQRNLFGSYLSRVGMILCRSSPATKCP